METNDPPYKTLEMLMRFVAPALKTQRILSVFEEVYPGLTEHCQIIVDTLEDRNMTSMERLLFVSTTLFVIGLMQEKFDPVVSTQDFTDLDDISSIDPLTHKPSFINPTLN